MLEKQPAQGAALPNGLDVRDWFDSATPGGEGAREFFLHAVRAGQRGRDPMTTTTCSLPVPVSFEFFPPNTPVGSEKLKTVVAELGAVEPEFFSVTYGAGGSTRDKTLATVSDIAALGQEAAPHLSCVGSTRDGIAEILATYRAQKIRRLVALRGDLPSGTATAGEFRYAQRADRASSARRKGATGTSRSPPTPSTTRSSATPSATCSTSPPR